MKKPIQLSLRTESTTIELTAEEGSPSRVIEMREMTAAQRDQYLDRLASRMRLDETGQPSGVKRFEGMQSDLLSICLFENGVNVSADVIQSWPASTVQQLFDVAQTMNHLKQEGEEPEKNG